MQPELLGQSHKFEFEGKEVRIDLPSASDLPDGENRSDQLSLTGWKETESGDVPRKYNIHRVNVFVHFDSELTFPTEVLSRSPNASDLFSSSQQKSLDKQTQKYGQIAENAFDLWIRTLRWQCRKSCIGRPEIQGHETGWTTYLIDENTNHRVWGSPLRMVIMFSDPVTVAQWKKVEKALSQRLQPPIYYEQFSDGEEHLRRDDLQRAVVDFAVACEVFIRTIVMRDLPDQLSQAVKDYIDETNIRKVMSSFFPAALDKDGNDILDRIRSELHKLFDARNEILHSGNMQDLDTDKCQNFRNATRKLIFSLETGSPEKT